MADYSRRVVINCAGTVSQVSYFLLSKYPSTLLCKLASTPNLSASHQGFDIFVDRDPTSFNVILNWYRYGRIVIPANVPSELVLDDIVYFQLPINADSLRAPTTTAPSVVGGPFLGIPSPALSTQPSVSSLSRADSFQLAPQLQHATSVAAPLSAATEQQPAINILPPTPPQLTPAASTALPPPAAAALQPQRSFVGQPLLVHQPSAAFSGVSSPVAAASGNYSSLGAGDMDESHLLNQGSVSFPFSHPPPNLRSVSAVVPHHSAPSSAAGVQLTSGHHRSATGASGALITPVSHPSMQKSFSTATPNNTSANTPTHASAAAASSRNTASPSVPPTISEEHSRTSSSAEISNPLSPPAAVVAPSTTAAATTHHTTPVIDTSSQSNSNTPLTSPSTAAFSHYGSAVPSTPSSSADSQSSGSISITPAPRAPFDLQIDMLSCYKEISRVESQTLLENAADGSYIFRPCSDANEKVDGKNNPNLFVLTYLHDKKVYNVKIFRLYIGEKNRISASTCRGFVFSELKEPQSKDQCFNSIFGLTIAIIGQNAQELQQA